MSRRHGSDINLFILVGLVPCRQLFLFFSSDVRSSTDDFFGHLFVKHAETGVDLAVLTNLGKIYDLW